MNEEIFKKQFAGFRGANDDTSYLSDFRIFKTAAMGFIDLFRGDSQPCAEEAEKKFTRAEVSQHWEEDSMWIIVRNQVYDITPFIRSHPGGKEVLLECAGHDATSDFFAVGHSEEALRLLEQYRIGSLVETPKTGSFNQ